jgi:hypothetical protein
MTASELITVLQQLPPDTTVTVHGCAICNHTGTVVRGGPDYTPKVGPHYDVVLCPWCRGEERLVLPKKVEDVTCAPID